MTTKITVSNDRSPGLRTVTQLGVRLSDGSEIWAVEVGLGYMPKITIPGVGYTWLDAEATKTTHYNEFTLTQARARLRDAAASMGLPRPENPITLIRRDISVILNEPVVVEIPANETEISRT